LVVISECTTTWLVTTASMTCLYDSVVWKLPELSCSRGDVFVLRTVGCSVAQRETLVEAIHYQVPVGTFALWYY